MITSKELLDKMLLENNEFTEIMIEFAKMHVKEALKQASEKAETYTEYENPVNPSMGSYEAVDGGLILDAYPIENIK